MMKHLFLILCTTLLNLDTSSQNIISKDQFLITGKIHDPLNGMIYLKYVNAEGHYVKDSSLIDQNSFVFKGSVNCYYNNADVIVKKTSPAHVLLDNTIKEFRLGLENKKISIFLSGNGITKMDVTGNVTEKTIANFYKEKLTPLLLAIEQLETLGSREDSFKISKLIKSYKTIISDYCSLYPNTNAATFILFDEHKYFTGPEFHSLFVKLSNQQQNSYFGKFIQKIMYRNELKRNQIGVTFADFKTIDYHGDSIALNDITRNGYVLLDFWASWCNPCRTSHPFLRNLYQKYQQYGFTIIGISCDTESNEVKWENAIQQDSVFYWPQILTSPPNTERIINRLDLLNEYQIQAFPTYILIDMKNKIVLRSYTGNELENKLKEIYGK